MPLDLANHDIKARQAIQAFWQGRAIARERQTAAGKLDQGERASVTAGRNMDGFLDLFHDIVHANGLHDADIHRHRPLLTLPGYFRPTKLWDMLVMHRGRLIAALELKSQVGSFGNNFNNRTEEALGTAHDFWIAYREGAFGPQARPFVGWLMLIEDAPDSRKAVKEVSPHFPINAAFGASSYQDRYEVLCRRMMVENLYSAASVITTTREAQDTGQYGELSDTTSLTHLVSALAGHVAATAARLA